MKKQTKEDRLDVKAAKRALKDPKNISWKKIKSSMKKVEKQIGRVWTRKNNLN